MTKKKKRFEAMLIKWISQFDSFDWHCFKTLFVSQDKDLDNQDKDLDFRSYVQDHDFQK